MSGESPIELPGTVKTAWAVTFSRNGRFAAASGMAEDSTTRVIRVWDTGSREEIASLDLGEVVYVGFLHFAGDGSLFSSTTDGLRRWDVETGESDVLYASPVGRFAVSGDDSTVLLVHEGNTEGTAYPLGSAVVLDAVTGLATPLSTHGDRVSSVAIDAAGTIAVTGDADGVIRVGPISGEEPHLLLGNRDEVFDLAIDPKGRWIASASGTEVSLWPMPDLSKPPLHTLPHDELIAKLKTLTNLRVVRDPDSATGWKLTHDPFPGWETVPTW
jgi:WD40 repeat protein